MKGAEGFYLGISIYELLTGNELKSESQIAGFALLIKEASSIVSLEGAVSS